MCLEIIPVPEKPVKRSIRRCETEMRDDGGGGKQSRVDNRLLKLKQVSDKAKRRRIVNTMRPRFFVLPVIQRMLRRRCPRLQSSRHTA